MLTVLEFIAVGALWGGSFLFMRIAGPEFGVLPLIGLRLAIGGLVLAPLCLARGYGSQIQGNFKKVFILGFTVSAAPFTLLAYTTVHTNAGFGAILNSTAPFFTAVIGWLWLKDRLTWIRKLGLLLGFLGVLMLVRGKLSFTSPVLGLSIASALTATFLYGFSTNYTKKYLNGVNPVVITAISQILGAAFMMPLVIFHWPSAIPSFRAWLSLILMGVFSTAVAFVLFYRLVERMGATRTIVVTYLIPVFGMLWGRLFLNENITLSMAMATGVILLGTALSTGFGAIFRKSQLPSSH